jgi:hypothetical protein
LEHEVFRESIEAASDSLVEGSGFHLIENSQIAIEDNLLAANYTYERLDGTSGSKPFAGLPGFGHESGS